MAKIAIYKKFGTQLYLQRLFRTCFAIVLSGLLDIYNNHVNYLEFVKMIDVARNVNPD